MTCRFTGSHTRPCSITKTAIRRYKPPTVGEIVAWEGRASDDLTHRRRLVSSNRSEEHTSELQSQSNLVCRLLLEKKKTAHICLSSSVGRHRPAPAYGLPSLNCLSTLASPSPGSTARAPTAGSMALGPVRSARALP